MFWYFGINENLTRHNVTTSKRAPREASNAEANAWVSSQASRVLHNIKKPVDNEYLESVRKPRMRSAGVFSSSPRRSFLLSTCLAGFQEFFWQVHIASTKKILSLQSIKRAQKINEQKKVCWSFFGVPDLLNMSGIRRKERNVVKIVLTHYTRLMIFVQPSPLKRFPFVCLKFGKWRLQSSKKNCAEISRRTEWSFSFRRRENGNVSIYILGYSETPWKTFQFSLQFFPVTFWRRGISKRTLARLLKVRFDFVPEHHKLKRLKWKLRFSDSGSHRRIDIQHLCEDYQYWACCGLCQGASQSLDFRDWGI